MSTATSSSRCTRTRASPAWGNRARIVKSTLTLEDGFLVIPDAPGIGVELAEDAAERHPYRPRQVKTRLHVDGSVVDQ